MNMNEIMEAALEEYEYYYDGFENDDSETVADSLHETLMSHDYQNSPYLDNALRVYYQLTHNSYQSATDPADQADFKATLDQLSAYFKQHQIEI